MIEICNLKNKKPEYEWDVIVDRTSVLGNPFIMRKESQRDTVCDAYEFYFDAELIGNLNFYNEIVRLVKLYDRHGKINLFCWCAPKRCHAETIRRHILSMADN